MSVVPNDLGGHPVIAMDEINHETLKWINRIRRKHGKGGLKKIRKGGRSGYTCPVANSLIDCVSSIYVGCGYIRISGTEQELPKYVIKFVNDFDNRTRYQDLAA